MLPHLSFLGGFKLDDLGDGETQGEDILWVGFEVMVVDVVVGVLMDGV